MSYISSYFHCVFSTKERRPFIQSELRERLWPFLGAIARQNKLTALEIGLDGRSRPLAAVAFGHDPGFKGDAIAQGRFGSSKWVHETFPGQRSFGWQEEYRAFSVSVSQLDGIVAYIRAQPEHHRNMTFEEEFLMLLKKHGVQYEERYLWKHAQPSRRDGRVFCAPTRS